jgi:hypothetical protein
MQCNIEKIKASFGTQHYFSGGVVFFFKKKKIAPLAALLELISHETVFFSHPSYQRQKPSAEQLFILDMII